MPVLARFLLFLTVYSLVIFFRVGGLFVSFEERLKFWTCSSPATPGEIPSYRQRPRTGYYSRRSSVTVFASWSNPIRRNWPLTARAASVGW